MTRKNIILVVSIILAISLFYTYYHLQPSEDIDTYSVATNPLLIELVLYTAILNLVIAIITLITKLIELLQQ